MRFFNKMLGIGARPVLQGGHGNASATFTEDSPGTSELPPQSDDFGECPWCQESLLDEEGLLPVVAPWEDGDNPHAYVLCRHCKQEVILYGHGGED